MGFTINTDGMEEEDIAILNRAEDIKDSTLYDLAWFTIAGHAHDANVLAWIDSLVDIDIELSKARAVK